MRLTTRLGLTILAVAPLTTGSAQITQQSAAPLDVNRGLPLAPTRAARFTTSEGTWMSVDVSPDGRSLVFDMLGKSVRVPVLFHYAENDRFFGPQVTRQWYQRFTAGGARAEYTLQPEFGNDGHFLFSEFTGLQHWLPTV